MNNKENFTIGSVKKRILFQAVPLILAQFVQLAYNIIDRVYIGRIQGSGVALTGIGVTFPIITFIVANTNLFGLGGVAFFSITRGKGDDEKAKKILGNVIGLQIITAVLLMVGMYVFMKPILYKFGASDESYVYARDYLSIYMLGTVFFMLGSGLNGFINATAHPGMGMLTTLIGAVLNMILDPIFIYGFGMGVKGAAIATVISQFVSFVWVMSFILFKFSLKLSKSDLYLSADIVKRVIVMGFPYYIMQATNSLVQLSCNVSLAKYDSNVYIGVMTVVNSVREMMALPVSGITGGSQPVLGYNYGAKRYDRVREGIRFTAFLGIAYTAFAWIVVLIIPKELMNIFTNDAAMIEAGVRALFLYFFGFIFMAFQFVGQATFQSLGYAKHAIFFSIFRKVIIVVPLTFLLPMMGLGVDGVFIAEPVSNLIGGLACFITMYITVYRRLGREKEE